MTQIGFYHLTRSPLEAALPRLLARVLAIPARALVLCRDAAAMALLDEALWRDPEWLPHGTGDAPRQPAFLTTEDQPPPNGATHLFLTGGTESANLPAFARAFDLFDGTDEAAVAAARTRWAAAREAGHELAYWKQSPTGWERSG